MMPYELYSTLIYLNTGGHKFAKKATNKQTKEERKKERKTIQRMKGSIDRPSSPLDSFCPLPGTHQAPSPSLTGSH